jgi:ribosomal protein L35
LRLLIIPDTIFPFALAPKDMKKSITKRIRITKNGKIIRRHMGIGHNGTRKGEDQKRRIANGGVVHASDSRLLMQELNRTLHLHKAGRPNKAN